MVKTLCFHLRGLEFDPWLGKFCMLCGVAKKKKKIFRKVKETIIKEVIQNLMTSQQMKNINTKIEMFKKKRTKWKFWK